MLYEDLFKFYLNLRFMSLFQVLFNPVTTALNVLFGIGYWVHTDTMATYQVPDDIKRNIVAHCGDLGDVNPEEANFKKMYLFLSYIVVILGAWYEQRYLASGKYLHVEDTPVRVSVARFLVCCACGLPFLLVPLLLLKKDTDNWYWNVFAIWASAACPMFYWFVLAKTVAIKANLANTRLGKFIGGAQRAYDSELVSIMIGSSVELLEKEAKELSDKINQSQQETDSSNDTPKINAQAKKNK